VTFVVDDTGAAAAASGIFCHDDFLVIDRFVIDLFLLNSGPAVIEPLAATSTAEVYSKGGVGFDIELDLVLNWTYCWTVFASEPNI